MDGVALARGPGEVIALPAQAASVPSEKLAGTQILWGWGAERQFVLLGILQTILVCVKIWKPQF